MPERSHLPWFFASLAGGGMAASAALAFIVPVILNPERFSALPAGLQSAIFDHSLPEYVALATMACLEIQRSQPDRSTRLVGFLAFGMLAGAVAWALASFAPTTFVGLVLPIIGLSAVLVRRPAGTAAALGTWAALTLVTSANEDGVVSRVRSAFGSFLVADRGNQRVLIHGTTQHGTQTLNCIKGGLELACRTPTTYYTEGGPLGLVTSELRALNGGTGLRIGVIGLGVGTAAVYCRSRDRLTFFEIDRAIVHTAVRYFRFLDAAGQDCGSLTIKIGDGRLLLRREPPDWYDLLVADAFLSDAIPVHLLTVEALNELGRAVSGSGVILFHTSSRVFDLASVVMAGATQSGLLAARLADGGGIDRTASEWVLVGRRPDLFASIDVRVRNAPDIKVTRPRKDAAIWSDDRKSMIEALRSRKH